MACVAFGTVTRKAFLDLNGKGPKWSLDQWHQLLGVTRVLWSYVMSRIGSVRRSLILLFALCLLGAGVGCAPSTPDGRTVIEMRLGKTVISFRVPDGYAIADTHEIEDAGGNLSLNYLFKGERSESSPYDLLVSLDQEGISADFDVDRPLSDQLDEEAEGLRAVGFDVFKKEVRTVAGRRALDIRARNDQEKILQAFILLEDGGSVGMFTNASANDAPLGPEFLFDTVLDTLKVD